MNKRWNIKEQPDESQSVELASQIGVLPVLAKLLIQRGVDTPDKAELFFNPSLDRLHDPFLMKDMDRAVDRLLLAISRHERILVYGDYDVDGTTAVALVHLALSRFVDDPARDLGFYIPDRYNEGYGISVKGVEYARANGYSLVIALDCGIKAVERMKTARSYGIDFIICDHHNPGDETPDVVACLDAKRTDCPYPDKNLSGCGVGFKLMQAFYQKKGLPLADLIPLLDLLVVSISSDIVPMTGENRILAFHGLRQMRSNPSVGLASIMKTSGVSGPDVSIGDIVFKIGPRINAAGRMRSGNDAVRLLISSDPVEADAISQLINDSNDERKDLDREITREAIGRIENSAELRSGFSTVLYEPKWSKGVIGIVASRLSETYLRPTIILTRSQANPEFATGSARSVEGFDLYRAIDCCSHLLENFGGHTYAAGLTMKVENVRAFQVEFERHAAALMAGDQPEPQVDVDVVIDLADATPELFEQLTRLEPFGPSNTKPVFVTRSVYDYRTSKTFGQRRQHLKLDVIDAKGRTVKSGVGFGMGNFYSHISQGAPFDICFTLENTECRGRCAMQLMVKDIHID